MKTAIASAHGGKENQDRARVFDGTVIALADGAGGTGAGARAAQAWIDAIAASLRPETWPAVVDALDADDVQRGPGQTTAIGLAVDARGVHGVCVGDSAVWIVLDDRVIDVAEHVPAKPLVGGGCMPSEIAHAFDRGTLLVASDGLVKYARMDPIAAVARGADLEAAAAALIELVRLPSGALQDDTTVVLCRR